MGGMESSGVSPSVLGEPLAGVLCKARECDPSRVGAPRGCWGRRAIPCGAGESLTLSLPWGVLSCTPANRSCAVFAVGRDEQAPPLPRAPGGSIWLQILPRPLCWHLVPGEKPLTLLSSP